MFWFIFTCKRAVFSLSSLWIISIYVWNHTSPCSILTQMPEYYNDIYLTQVTKPHPQKHPNPNDFLSIFYHLFIPIEKNKTKSLPLCCCDFTARVATSGPGDRRAADHEAKSSESWRHPLARLLKGQWAILGKIAVMLCGAGRTIFRILRSLGFFQRTHKSDS